MLGRQKAILEERERRVRRLRTFFLGCLVTFPLEFLRYQDGDSLVLDDVCGRIERI